MNNNKEWWVVLKMVELIEVESEFSISIGCNSNENSVVLLLQIHHLINTNTRICFVAENILMQWVFMSLRFLKEIDIESSDDTQKENKLNHKEMNTVNNQEIVQRRDQSTQYLNHSNLEWSSCWFKWLMNGRRYKMIISRSGMMAVSTFHCFYSSNKDHWDC